MNLTSQQTDALTEAINIGVGRAAAMLSELISLRIDLRVPEVELYSRDQATRYFESNQLTDSTAISQNFTGSINGQANLVFPHSAGLSLASLLCGDESAEEMNSELNGVLLEVGNIVLNGVLGSISNLISSNLDYTVPTVCDHSLEAELFGNLSQDKPDQLSTLLFANTLFTVANKDIKGSILIAFELGAIDTLTQSLDSLA